MTFMAVSCCWRLLKALKKNTQSKISSFCALGPKKAVKKYKETFVQISASSLFLLLAGQEASCLSLESDDDDGQFEISLLLQLSQNSRPEEHLTLTDAIQVRIQIQVLHLEEERRRQEGRTEDEWNRTPSSYYFIIVTSFLKFWLTIRQHACFPSMKPFGMALAARISYLQTRTTFNETSKRSVTQIYTTIYILNEVCCDLDEATLKINSW